MKKKYNIIILIFIFPLLLASCSKEKRKPASFMAGDYSGTLYLESDTLVNYLVTVIEVRKK
jgi:major membrane immunogen (membrane-anchored lipoprotein)